MVVGSRLGKGISSIRRPRLGFCTKVSLAVLLGLSFIVCWSMFSSPASDVVSKRSSFEDIESEPGGSKGPGAGHRHSPSRSRSPSAGHKPGKPAGSGADKDGGKRHKGKPKGQQHERHGGNNVHGGSGNVTHGIYNDGSKDGLDKPDESKENGVEDEKEEVEEVTDEQAATDSDAEEPLDVFTVDEGEEEAEGEEDANTNKAKKSIGPLFHSEAREWKLCGGRSGQNYIPCVDLEGATSGKLQSHRHHERSCPRTPLMCLIPLPQGYNSSVPWPESQSKIFYRNVVHPMLSAYVKTHNWLTLSDDYLTFPFNESITKSDYLDFIVEMVPDIDWGKNIRTVLDIGSTDATFARALFEKDVLVLSLGMMSDQTDLAQLYLERGFPALIGSLGTRRLPFPSGIFDAIHCSECNVVWHANGGRLLIEMNRILRPGGYFILSLRHGDAEGEKGMSKLTSSVCWNVLAHKTDEDTDLSVKMYQRPSSNDMYELRRTKNPPLCKEDENQDAAWYTPIKSCLHTIPTSLEQRGTEWPEEWPKRLENIPEWLTDSQDKLLSDTKHWKAIIQKSYINGTGIDWSLVRNVMDMKAIYGGFAAALASQKVWVMNVVPIHAPNTLPIIFERGLIGVYHDWCEPFSTYPRSYDLLHADHLFSRLKNRCKNPVSIVVEMDRILRPRGWAIIREKLEILTHLETILKSLNWEIRMSFSQNNQGILCAQKTDWRP